MNVTANTGHATRIGRITISLGWQEVFIDVRQAGSNTVTIYWQNPFGDPIAPWHNMIPGLPLSQRSNVLPTPTMHHGYVFDRWLPFCIFTELRAAPLSGYELPSEYQLVDGFAFMPLPETLPQTPVPDTGMRNYATRPFFLVAEQAVPATRNTVRFYVDPIYRNYVSEYFVTAQFESWIRDVRYDHNTGAIIATIEPNPSTNSRWGDITVLFGRTERGRFSRTVRVVQSGGGQVTVTFDFGVNPQSEISRNVPIGSSLASAGQSLPMPNETVWMQPGISSRRGFIGWFKHSPGGGIRVDANTTFSSNTRVHARWTNPGNNIHFWWRDWSHPITHLNLSNLVNDPWYGYINKGIVNWNSAHGNPTRAYSNPDLGWWNVVEIRPASNVFVVSNGDQLHLGGFESNPYPYPTTATSAINFRIVFYRDDIRAYMLENYPIEHAAGNIGQLVSSIMAHEIGHVFGLADNPPTWIPNQSLMNHERNRLLINRPQPFDIQNLNWIYQP